MNSSELSERIEQALARMMLNPPGKRESAGWYKSKTARGLVKSLGRGEAMLRFEGKIGDDQAWGIIELLRHACASVCARHGVRVKACPYGGGVVLLRWTKYEKISVDKSWARN